MDMASRVTYQNICIEVTRKPLRVMSLDAKVESDITRQDFRSCHQWQIFWYSRPCDICHVTFLNKSKVD